MLSLLTFPLSSTEKGKIACFLPNFRGISLEILLLNSMQRCYSNLTARLALLNNREESSTALSGIADEGTLVFFHSLLQIFIHCSA